MQKTIVQIDYCYHENNVYISQGDYEYLKKLNMIIMHYCDYDVIKSIKMFSKLEKISFATLQTHINKKLLVIFINKNDENNFKYQHQHQLAKINKNIYFGCCAFYGNDISSGKNIFNVRKCVYDGMSRFVVIHMVYHSPLDIDLSDHICLQNVYHCVVDIPRLKDNQCSEQLHYRICDWDGRYKINFKLPYGCIVEIIDDFNRLIF